MNVSLTSLIRLRCQDRWMKKLLLTSVVQHVLFLYFGLVLLTRHQLNRRKYRLHHLLFWVHLKRRGRAIYQYNNYISEQIVHLYIVSYIS